MRCKKLPSVSNSSNRLILTLVLLAATVASDALAGNAKWAWSQQIPGQLKTESGRGNRTPDAVDKLFRGPPRPPGIKDILDVLGLPEGFSPQLIHSRTEGTGGSSRAGGTLRFLLADGGELHVWTADFSSVGLAIRHRKKGRSVVLFK